VRHPCLGDPVQCTEPVSVQLGSGSYDMPILCPIMVELGVAVEVASGVCVAEGCVRSKGRSMKVSLLTALELDAQW
jgi:hypothetical protein